jgi:hypothetical protein
MVMSDENSYYAWREIEKVRANMLADTRVVEFEDYGSRAARSLEDGSGTAHSLENGSGAAYGLVFRERRRVCDIAKGSLAKKKYAQMLARLVNWLGEPLLTSPLRGGIGDWRLAIGNGQEVDGIVLNAGGYTHTSIALRDAVACSRVPVVEVHVSDIMQREPFRQISLLTDVCAHSVIGQGTDGYRQAVEWILNRTTQHTDE